MDWQLSGAEGRQGREFTLNEDSSACKVKRCADQWDSSLNVFNIIELHTKNKKLDS